MQYENKIEFLTWLQNIPHPSKPLNTVKTFFLINQKENLSIINNKHLLTLLTGTKTGDDDQQQYV